MENAPVLNKTNSSTMTGAVLKWIALVSMLIDHSAVVMIEQGLRVAQGWDLTIYHIDLFFRTLGRLAFPIYCFLLAEGFRHTRSRGRYLARLLIFALLSELPFDLALQRSFLELRYQNVFLTLALGLLAIWANCQLVGAGAARRLSFWRILCACAATAGLMAAAHLANTDYGAMGVLLILVMYLLRGRPWLRDICVMLTLAGMLLFHSHWIELFGGLSLILIHAYNGERGRQSKYLFYAFYPGHLLVLTVIRAVVFGSWLIQ